MTVCILKPCEVRHNNSLLNLKVGDFLSIPDSKESKLIKSGLARTAVVDDYREVITSFGSGSPCRLCWETIKRDNPGIWRRHIKALLENDISTARLTYKELLTAGTAD